MEFLEVLLIALAMSIDAFSVALGLGCGRCSRLTAIKTAVAFGLFQFFMPLLGAFAGLALDKYFFGTKYISAAILFLIAFKMFKDARSNKGEVLECDVNDPTKGFGIIMLSLATSMDAFGVGIPVALMSMNTYLIAGIIGVVCFIITLAGFFLGRLCVNYVNKAEYLGAVVLAAIGVKFLFF